MEPHSGLNNLDYIVIGIILLSACLALMRGFVREMFSLVAWVGAYFAAIRFYPHVTPWMHHYIKNDKASEWAAMAAVYITALILLVALGALIAHFVIRGRALTAIDRSLGFLYGLARGVLVIALVYLGAVMIFWPDLDKAAPPIVLKPASEPSQNAEGDKDRNEPPAFLVHAKTRPLMAFAANRLHVFIPQQMIDKTLQEYSGQKKAAQKTIDQQVLDDLTTPAPAHTPSEPETPSY